MKQEPIPIGRCIFYIKALSASEILSLRNDQNFYKNKRTRNSKDGNKQRSWCRTEKSTTWAILVCSIWSFWALVGL